MALLAVLSRSSRVRRALAAAAMMALGPALCADTLVTKDGRHFTGEVTKLDTEYVVKTKFGEVHVSLNDFDHLDKGATPAPAATSITPHTTTTPPRPATPAAGNGSKKAIDPQTLEALLKQGREAMAAGEYKAARDAYSDAAAGADKNVEAQHGLALAYMYLNDFNRAREPMEKAIQAAGPNASRSLVLNMCICQIGLKNPMRGAKAVMEYLQARPSGDLDEPMLNAMGTALNVSDPQAKKAGLFQQCATFYIAYNAKLEAKVPGYKRWGVLWEPAAEVDRKNASNEKVNRDLSRLEAEWNDLDRQIGAYQQQVNSLPELVKRGKRTMDEYNRAVAGLKDATEKRDKNQKAWDAEVAKLQPPAFPRTMTLVAMDDLTPPQVSGPTALASAGSTNGPLFPEMTQSRPPAHRTSTPAKKPENTNMNTGGGNTPTPPEEPPQIAIATQPKAKKSVRIQQYAAAFPVGENLVLTTAEAVAKATEITVQTADGTPMKGELVRADEASGLALIRVTERKFVPLALATSFNGGSIQCPGYAVMSLFNPVAESITGNAKPPAAGWKVALNRNPRLAGSPILSGNKVVGVELTTRDTDIANIPAVTLDQIRQFLGSDGATSNNGAADPAAALLQLTAVRESAGE